MEPKFILATIHRQQAINHCFQKYGYAIMIELLCVCSNDQPNVNCVVSVSWHVPWWAHVCWCLVTVSWHVPWWAIMLAGVWFQSVGMFLGELSCLLVFGVLMCTSRRAAARGGDDSNAVKCCAFNWLVFLPASCCDIIGTSTMYIGLNLTYPSSFQMLRGECLLRFACFYVWLKI